MKSAVASSKVERRKQGKALREKCSRSAHAEWKLRSKSQDIVKLLEEPDADRIAGLILVKYQRMSASPFTFDRGIVIIQAESDFTTSQKVIRSGRLSTERAKSAGLEFLL